jgi:transcriptional regulator with XRE-family HTH domain
MFKDRIKELRTENNLSVTEFAKAIGVSKSSASLYESGRQNPGPKTIETICRTFDVDEEWLLGEDGKITGAEKDQKKQSKKKDKNKKKEEITEAKAVPETKEPEAEEPAAEPAKEELTAEVEEKPAEKEKPAKKEKKEKLTKEIEEANMKGEKKMSKKKKNYGFVPPVPPVPFSRWNASQNENDAKDEVEDDAKKENIKSTVKSAWMQKIDRKKSSADSRKEQWKKFFDYRMDLQDTFASSLPDDTSSLPPFMQLLPLSPKDLMERLKKFELMANEHIMEQADSFADFCIQGQQQFYDLVIAAMDNADARKKEEAEEK